MGDIQFSRRTFLVIGTGILAGCGGGTADKLPEVAQYTITATLADRSVYDNTLMSHSILASQNEQLNDTKVIEVSSPNVSMLAGDDLVFEVNGQRRVSEADSANKTIVQLGDIITWKHAR